MGNVPYRFMPYLWLRIFGKRIGIMRDDGSAPLFSERYGYTKVWRGLGCKVKMHDALESDPRLFWGIWRPVFKWNEAAFKSGPPLR